MEKEIGKTKDVGCQFGIRKTFPVPKEVAWDFLFTESGLEIWLGKLKSDLELKKDFVTEKGKIGLVSVLKPYSHIRMNWKPKSWENMSTVQIRVIGEKNKSTIAIHHEKLLNAKQRIEMKEYWGKIMKNLTSELDGTVK